MEADESEGKMFWASCWTPLFLHMYCNRKLPCPKDFDAKTSYKYDNLARVNAVLKLSPALEGGRNVANGRNVGKCDPNKPRLPYTAASAARAAALYKKAIGQAKQKIWAQPSIANTRPESDNTKFASLPVGQCFGALREEIHTATACKEAAEYLKKKRQPVAGQVLEFKGEVKEIETEDASPEPSRCYVNLNRHDVKLSNGTTVHLRSRDIVFNTRASAHDAEADKYTKICGVFLDAAETGSAYDFSGAAVCASRS